MFTLLNTILLFVILLQILKLRRDVVSIDVPDCRRCPRNVKKM